MKIFLPFQIPKLVKSLPFYIPEAVKAGLTQGLAENLQAYKHIFSELAVVEGIVVRGDRIVVPKLLRQRMIEITHEGHQGQVRTKQLLRAHVWFPGMDS